MKNSKLILSILLLALGSLFCSRNKLQVTNLDVSKQGTNARNVSFVAGEHILVNCRVSGFALDSKRRCDVQADVLLLAPDSSDAGKWSPAWTNYNFFRTDAVVSSGEASIAINGDLMPDVQPGNYRLHIVVRDAIAMTKKEIESSEIRIAPRARAPEPETVQEIVNTTPAQASEDPGATFQKALALFQAGNNSAALRLFELVSAARPDYPEVNYNIGVIKRAMGNHDGAIVAFKTELARDPNHYGSLTTLGDMYVADNDLGNAATMYQKALAAYPERAYPGCKLGEVYLLQKNYESAIRALKTVLKNDPRNLMASVNLGTAYLRKGDNGAAIGILSQIAKDPATPAIVHLNYALALFKDRKYAEAKDEALKAQSMGQQVDPKFLADCDLGASAK